MCPDSAFESQCRLPRIMLAGSLLYFVGRPNIVKDPDKHSERDRTVGYSNYATGWTTGKSCFDSRQGQKNFPPYKALRPILGVHMASYSTGTWSSFARGKQPELQADHSFHLISRSKQLRRHTDDFVVCLSLRMKQSDTPQTNFREISHLRNLLKFLTHLDFAEISTKKNILCNKSDLPP